MRDPGDGYSSKQLLEHALSPGDEKLFTRGHQHLSLVPNCCEQQSKTLGEKNAPAHSQELVYKKIKIVNDNSKKSCSGENKNVQVKDQVSKFVLNEKTGNLPNFTCECSALTK